MANLNEHDVTVKAFNTDTEAVLTGFTGFKEEETVNESRQITFSVSLNASNMAGYSLVWHENLVEYHGQDYVIKNVEVSEQYRKEVTAVHVGFEFQNHYIEATNTDSDKAITYTISQYLDKAFDGNTLGYKYVLHGSFKTISTTDDIGGKNGLEMVKDGVELFGYLFKPSNKNFHIFASADDYYNASQEVIRYLYNTKETKVATNTYNLRTRVTGYGKKKQKDGKYSIAKGKDATLSGKWVEKGTYYSEDPTTSTSFSTKVTVDFDGDSLYLNLKKGTQGGIVKVTYGSDYSKTFSQWASSSSTEQITLDKSAKKGAYTVKVTFVKEDPDHKMKVKTVNEYETVTDPKTGKKKRVKKKVTKRTPNRLYLGTETGTVTWAVLNTAGDNLYYTKTTYISPNEKQWGRREAPAISDERFTDEASLKAYLKTQLLDVPETTLELTYTGEYALTARSSVYFIHEPMSFETELQVVSISTPHPSVSKVKELTFSNKPKSLTRIQRQIARQAKDANRKATTSINRVAGITITNDNGLTSEVIGEVDD